MFPSLQVLSLLSQLYSDDISEDQAAQQLADLTRVGLPTSADTTMRADAAEAVAAVVAAKTMGGAAPQAAAAAAARPAPPSGWASRTGFVMDDPARLMRLINRSAQVRGSQLALPIAGTGSGAGAAVTLGATSSSLSTAAVLSSAASALWPSASASASASSTSRGQQPVIAQRPAPAPVSTPTPISTAPAITGGGAAAGQGCDGKMDLAPTVAGASSRRCASSRAPVVVVTSPQTMALERGSARGGSSGGGGGGLLGVASSLVSGIASSANPGYAGIDTGAGLAAGMKAAPTGGVTKAAAAPSWGQRRDVGPGGPRDQLDASAEAFTSSALSASGGQGRRW